MPEGAIFHSLGRIGNRLGGTVPVVVDRVGQVFSRGPNGKQIIAALVIHSHLIAREIHGVAAGSGCPAAKIIAIVFKAQVSDTYKLNFLVVVVGAAGSNICAVVGVIGQGNLRGFFAPDGVEGDVGVMDGNLVAGLIDGAAAYLGTPAQEHLALGGGQRGSGHDIGVGAVGIGLGIHRHISGAIGAVVGDGKGLVAGVVGVKGNIAANFRIEVEGGVDIVGSSSAPHSPVSPGVAIGNSDRGEILLVDLGAIGDLDGLRAIALYGQIGSSGNGRRSPLGVEHQVAAGHGSAGPVELRASRAALGGVPAGERIGFRDSRGLGGRIVLTADIRFVVNILDGFMVVAIDEGQVILITSVVEVYIVVYTFFTRTVPFGTINFFRKASQRLLSPGCLLIVSNNLIELRTINIVLSISVATDRLEHIVQMIGVPCTGPLESVVRIAVICCTA